MKNALVILAGGKGKRFGGKIPKQFIDNGQGNFIEFMLKNININNFSHIVIACQKNYYIKLFKKITVNNNYIKIINSQPGKNRQQSSYFALKKLENFKINNVLIHDAARPLVTDKLIEKILFNLKKYKTVIPYINYSDRKIHNNKQINNNIKNIQTPQGFDYKLILSAHKYLKKNNFSDDSSLIENLGKKIKYLKGEKTNLKITYKEDLNFFNLFKKKYFCHGIGYDIHRFDKNTNDGLKLCGIKIPFKKLIGHSDADVGIHAICDSIFGALSMNDIGYYFKNDDKKWKNANSKIFLLHCKKLLIDRKFFIVNLDINFICEKPNINKYSLKMKKNIANLLSIPDNIISIKATTNEKLGFIGNEEGIAAESIIQISNEKFY
tara:strand:+ start:828 stop:1967 length:1140 start_codon:yes stop_codon:yes gene_type:complete